MTSFMSLKFLLLLLLLHQVYTEEPEPVFRAKSSTIEMGYCFGVDYIVIYRTGPEGDQLLSISSASSNTITLPADLEGRIHPNQRDHLLGVQINNLTFMDSGIYRRECWQNQTLVSHYTQQLLVCDEEVGSEEIIVKEGTEETTILCNSTSTHLKGTSVRWYYEIFPFYRLTLFLDSSVSLEPLLEELRGVMEVKYKGFLLVVKNSMLKTIQHFHCLVIDDKNCLSFQNMYLPDRSESRDVFASQGDKLVLKCPSDGYNQQWETPLGLMNSSSTKNDQMHISTGDKLEDFSLVIPDVTDKHIGDYSCISSSLELQYHLILCPRNETQENFDFEVRSISLDCKVDHGESQRVKWYRRESSGEYNLIHDSNDNTVPIPEDLMGRLTLSDNGLMLTISNVEKTDEGVYRCIVLKDHKLLEGEYEYIDFDDYVQEHKDFDDYVQEHKGDDEYGDNEYLPDTNRCIFKQTTLTLRHKWKNTILEPGNRINSTTKDPTAYAAGTAVAILLVGVIVAVIVVIVKKRQATSQPGQHTNMDIKMNEYPSCTDPLTNE